MKTYVTAGLVAGGLVAAYTLFGKKIRFLGDKAEVGDVVSVPVTSFPAGTFGSGLFGDTPGGGQGLFTGIVKDAGKDALSVSPSGVIVSTPASGDQLALFPRQTALNAQGVLVSVLRSQVARIDRGGRPVIL